jgi:Tfp pilus assembly protein FimT
MNTRLKMNQGFTILEIIVILIVMGIIGVIVISRLWGTDVNLIGQTEVVKSHLRYAQSRAMNTDVIWGINLTGSTYSLFKNGSTANKVILPAEDSNTRSLPSGITVETAIISFDSWGIPHTDAAATDGQELAAGDSEEEITISSSGDAKTITVTPNTGFIP